MDMLDALSVFVAAADAGSFAGAGRRLRRTRDAVSKTVAALEAALGAPLFTRSTRRLDLTDAGVAYLERIQPLLQELEAARQIVRDGTFGPHGRLRVNAPMAWSNVVLAPLVAGFLEAYPNVPLDLRLEDRVLDPIPPDVDITIRISASRETPLASEDLGRIRRGLYAAPTYLRSAGRPLRPEDLTRHRCLHYGYLATGSEWILQRGTDVRRLAIQGHLACNSGAVLAAAAFDGAGIALLPDFLADADVAAGRLEAVLPAWSIAPLVLHAIIPPTRQISARVRSFCDYLQGKLATALA